MKLLRGPIKIALAASMLVPVMQSFAQPPNATTIRPIEDFLVRQGTFCIDQNGNLGYEDQIVDGNFVGNCSTSTPETPAAPPVLFVPPVANFIGFFDPDKARLLSVDFAGLADYWSGDYFGTTFAGTVVEQPLADGRAMVKVILHTHNALTWVVDNSDNSGDFNGPLLFGNRAPEVLGGADPALGRSHMRLEFINTAPGAELPDLLQLAGWPEEGQELLSLKVTNQAEGPLKELFGVPEGTPGRTHGVQNGLLANPQCGADSPSAVADCFPAERIELQATGR